MSREDAIQELALILEEHRKQPAFGCSCMPIDEVTWARQTLDTSWELHVAGIALQASAGF